MQQPLERLVEDTTHEAEGGGHAVAAVERGAAGVGGERQEQQHGGGFGTKRAQPVLVQQAPREPAEGLPGSAPQVRPRRERRRAGFHADFFRLPGSLDLRARRRSASRSLASLRR